MTFLTGFSWQKSLDLASSTAFEGDLGTYPYGRILKDYGISDFNRKARFTGSFNYQVPGPKTGLAHALVGGWQLNGIVTLQTGPPLTINTGFDNSFSGIGNDRVDVIGNPYTGLGGSRGAQIQEWFNIAAFTANAPGTFGALGRNTMVGPGYADFDSSLFKAFTMPYSERHKVEFRAEFFNLLNRVNLGNPNTTFSSAISPILPAPTIRGFCSLDCAILFRQMRTLLALFTLCAALCAQTTVRQVERLLEPALQSPDVVAYQLRQYLDRKTLAPAGPTSAAQWSEEAKHIRRRVLDDVIFHRWPREWVDAPLKAEDLGTIPSGPGYRLASWLPMPKKLTRQKNS